MKKKFFSIQQKLLFLLAALILFPAILIGGIGYLNASKTTEKQIRNAAEASMAQIKDNISTFMKMHGENMTALAADSAIINASSDAGSKALIDTLAQYQEGHGDILTAYVARSDKKMLLYPEQELPEGFDPMTRPWYQAAVENNKVSWTSPYIDAGTGRLVVTVSIPVYQESEFVGVLGADIALDQMTSVISKSKIGNDGYIALLDDKGVVIAHPDSTLLGKEFPVADVKAAILSDESGSQDYTYEKQRKCAYYTTLGNETGWKIIGVLEYKEILELNSGILISTIISALIIVIIAQILGYVVSRPIVKSVKALSADMVKIGEGDLTVRSRIKARDEIGLLSDTMNIMAEDLDVLMNNIKAASADVFSSADSLAASSQQAAASTEEVSRTVAEIANATEDQARNTETGHSKTTELAENIQSISETIYHISDKVTQSVELNQQGITIMKELKLKTEANGAASEEVAKVILEVDEGSEQIGVIIDTIRNISSQTNLLALNASIEAARAGEQGKGFAVVADEIRKLATQSAKAADDISNLIEIIQGKSKNAVNTMDGTKPIVEAMDEAVISTQGVFADISAVIQNLSKNVNIISEFNQSMVNNKNEILSIMENISASAEETSASTQQVAASSQEQLAGMEEVARTAEQLNMLAQSLSSGIEKFKISSSEAATALDASIVKEM